LTSHRIFGLRSDLGSSSSARINSAAAINPFDRAKVDFSPVYQCMHIYESLEQGDQVQCIMSKKSRRSDFLK
jgi:hypothetical protein